MRAKDAIFEEYPEVKELWETRPVGEDEWEAEEKAAVEALWPEIEEMYDTRPMT